MHQKKKRFIVSIHSLVEPCARCVENTKNKKKRVRNGFSAYATMLGDDEQKKTRVAFDVVAFHCILKVFFLSVLLLLFAIYPLCRFSEFYAFFLPWSCFVQALNNSRAIITQFSHKKSATLSTKRVKPKVSLGTLAFLGLSVLRWLQPPPHHVSDVGASRVFFSASFFLASFLLGNSLALLWLFFNAIKTAAQHCILLSVNCCSRVHSLEDNVGYAAAMLHSSRPPPSKWNIQQHDGEKQWPKRSQWIRCVHLLIHIFTHRNLPLADCVLM